MDLSKTGKLIAHLRKEQGLTQKNVADLLGVCSKTVSKWETGHGFPDISLISELSKILRVDTLTLINGELPEIKTSGCNVMKTKFYICKNCGNIITSTKNTNVICCGRNINSLDVTPMDEIHKLNIERIENDYYITFSHPMTKEHYISFFAYVRSDGVLMIKLYPEQGGEVRFPLMFGGKLYFYCTQDGLFECNLTKKQ